MYINTIFFFFVQCKFFSSHPLRLCWLQSKRTYVYAWILFNEIISHQLVLIWYSARKPVNLRYRILIFLLKRGQIYIYMYINHTFIYICNMYSIFVFCRNQASLSLSIQPLPVFILMGNRSGVLILICFHFIWLLKSYSTFWKTNHLIERSLNIPLHSPKV